MWVIYKIVGGRDRENAQEPCYVVIEDGKLGDYISNKFPSVGFLQTEEIMRDDSREALRAIALLKGKPCSE